MPDWKSWPENGFCYLSRQEGFILKAQLFMNLAKASPSAMDGLIPSPKAPLLGQVREVMRVPHYSLRTEEAYLQLCGSEGNAGFTPVLFSLFAPVQAGDSIVRPGQPHSEQEATEGTEASLLLCAL